MVNTYKSFRYKSFKKNFLNSIKKNKDNKLIIENKGSEDFYISYKDLYVLIQRFNNFITKKKIKKKSTAVVYLPNSIENIVIFLSCMMNDINYAPININSSKLEINNWINLIKPSLFFYQNIEKKNLDYKILKKNKVKIIGLNLNFKFKWLPKKLKKINLTSKNNTLIFLQTSGTTGKSKAIVHDINNLWTSGYYFCKFHNILNSRLRFWNFLSMSYLGGLHNLCLIPISTNGSIVVDEQFSGKTFLNFWRFIKKYKISCIWLIPTIVWGLIKLYSKLNNQQILKINKTIKKAFVSTAPIDIKIKEKFEKKFKLKIFDCYGISETTWVSCEKKNTKRYKNSVGNIFSFVKLKFFKNNKFQEIKVKSPFLFRGYLDEKGKIDQNLNKDGFFHTGDLGEKKNNTLLLKGRNTDIIKKGGYLINLNEIEVFTKSFLKNIDDIAAIKTNDCFYGEDYYLFISIKRIKNKNFKIHIQDEIFKNLSKHKLPKKIIFKKYFPKTTSGKIKKYLLEKCV